MTVAGKTVGTATVHVVIPDSIKFNQTAITVPYGKTTNFSVSAYYGINEVEALDSDFSFSLEESNIGKLNGTLFEATTNNTISGGAIKATLICNSSVTTSVPVVLGKGSEILYTFENGFADDWYVEHFQYRKAFATRYVYPQVANFNFILKSYAVTSENGMVHSGNGAGAIYSDTTYGTNNWPGAYITWAGEKKTYENATRIGAWIYHPKDAVSAQVTFSLDVVKNGVTSTKQLSASNYGDSTKYEESGWHYYSVDVSEYDAIILNKSTPTPKTKDDIGKFARWDGFAIEIRIQLNGGESGDYSWKTEPGVRGQNTFYIDDVIIDFSDACDDREAPVFGDVYVGDTKLNNQRQSTTTVSGNGFVFRAYVAEDTTRVNASGLNATTAKAYVDGQEIECSFDGSKIVTPNLYLSNGVHTIKFVICDNAGNYASVIRKVNISGADADADIRIVPKTDATLIFTGSQYWIDVIAENVENVEKITVALDLNNTNAWLAEHIETLYGFTATYSKDVAGENTLYLTLERTGNVYATGETVIASVPIQTWEWNEDDYPGYDPNSTTDSDLNGNQMYDPYEFWKARLTHNFDVIVNPLSGKVVFIDSTEKWFSGETIKVDTEQQIGVWTGQGWDDATTGYIAQYFGDKSSWHLHSAGAPQDKAATCTEAGYTGRVFCTGCSCVTESELGHKCDSAEGCDAVLDWGTTIPATGHSYEAVDGVLKCHCGKTFSGVYTDGKTYENGVIANGWLENSYYVNGVKLTGIQKVDGFYYNFGTDGVSQGKYTGLFYDETGKVYRYAQLGKLSSGWKQIDDEWYYFRQSTLAAVVGQYTYSGISYTFTDEGKLTSGVWVTNEQGTRYYYAASYYYKAGSAASVTFATINGKEYGFDKSGYMYKNGMYSLKLSNQKHLTFYTFDENGVCAGLFDLTAYTGLVKTVNEGIYYYENGVLSHAGIVKIDGNYYYAGTGGVVVTNTSKVVYPGYTNGLISPGTYEFDENGRMAYQNGVYEQDGKLYYFVNGQRTHAGMITFDGNLYYAGTGGLVVTNTSKFVYYGYANGLVPPGSYEFGDDGKLILLNGIHERDGVLYYFLDGIKTHAGVIEIGGDYYYAATGGVIVRNTSKIIYSDYTNDLTVPGTYTFDIDGKMQCVNGVYEQNGVLYYFEKGVKTHAGIIKIDGEIYYAGTNGVVVSNATKLVYPGYTNGIIPPGTYEFDAEGKMKCANGIYEIDGVLYYFVDAVRTHAGVIQVDGCYYYAGTGGIIVRNTSKFVYFGYANGLVAPGTYKFNNEGKMIIE